MLKEKIMKYILASIWNLIQDIKKSILVNQLCGIHYGSVFYLSLLCKPYLKETYTNGLISERKYFTNPPHGALKSIIRYDKEGHVTFQKELDGFGFPTYVYTKRLPGNVIESVCYHQTLEHGTRQVKSVRFFTGKNWHPIGIWKEFDIEGKLTKSEAYSHLT